MTRVLGRRLEYRWERVTKIAIGHYAHELGVHGDGQLIDAMLLE
jgi:hypothetical protein